MRKALATAQTNFAVNETVHRFKRPESVLVVIYTDEMDVLLLRRIPPWDFWQSITGSLNWPDETAMAAAKREVAEETGLCFDVDDPSGNWTDWQRSECFRIHPKWSHRYGPGVTQNREHVFSLKLRRRCPITIEPSEHVEFCWRSFDAAHALAWSWTNKKALKLIAKTEGLAMLD